MRVLITGITGFTGSHLADFLSKKKDVEVYGLARHSAGKKVYGCDIRDEKKLEKIVRDVRPERIFHLAAQSSMPYSWKHPQETFEHNLLGTLNLLEAARKLPVPPRIQLAGSAHEYGTPLKKVARISESVPVNPSSPYAISKTAQDLLASQYVRQYGMKIVRTRAFNYIGPRQSADFVASSFAWQIARIEAGSQKPEILVGNLDAVRDYTDVRDVVRAYWLSLEKAKMGEVYNIASGQGRAAREILDIYLRLTPIKIEIKKDAARMRPSDLPRLVGDGGKFVRQTGWKRLIPFEKSLADILQFWREKVKNEKVAYGKA